MNGTRIALAFITDPDVASLASFEDVAAVPEVGEEMTLERARDLGDRPEVGHYRVVSRRWRWMDYPNVRKATVYVTIEEMS